ncbi:MAG: MurR/RpiR family transcriptional regulator [Clostridium sp.]|jgi:DNA-binding MurR/RpiR family transcriptional regulator|nr:MurR/RpiR family transcriptional regulator [Clostridium sp.]
MDKNHDLIKKIQSRMADFSKGQKLIANFIINHYDRAAYMTAAKLGDEVGVSESTVVRFANEIGFDGYPKLQKVLKELNKSKLTSVQRIKISSDRINEDNLLKSVLQEDMNKIRHTLEEIDQSNFNNIVESILNAKTIYILGVRSSAPLASFLGFYFNLIFDNVRLVHTTSVSEMFEQIIHASKEDVVIGISFPRYSKRTVNAMRFAKNKGATVVAITDNLNSPLAENADHVITARSDMASFVDSLVAPLSVINALIVAVGLKRKQHIYDTFENLEKIWDEYKVYETLDHE